MAEPTVRLRAVTEADLPDYVQWLNDPEVAQFLKAEPGTFTLEGERQWLAKKREPGCRNPVWAIEAEGRHIGNCGLDLHEGQPTGTAGIAIGHKPAWGQGYGTRAMSELLRIGFEEHHLERIQLSAWGFNSRAIRCYEKCGFVHEGLQRRAVRKAAGWIDVVKMGILREEWQERQTPPRDGLCRLWPTDAAALIELWSRPEVGLWPHAAEDEGMVWRALAHNHRYTVGWRHGGELVGSVIGAWDGWRGWYYRVAVRGDCRRQGIAGAMIKEVEGRLLAAGARQINLVAWDQNSEGIAFYETLGYQANRSALLMYRRW